MSVISEKVRKALFAKMDVASVKTPIGLATAVYADKAPKTAVFPYVIFQQQASSPVTRNFGQTLVLEDDLWLIKGVADEDSSTTKEPQEVAAEIANLCEAAIGTTLTLTGNTAALVERIQDMPKFEEKKDDGFVYHRGFLLRVAVE